MLDNLSLKQKKIIVIIGIIILIGVMYLIYNKNEKQSINVDENILINKSEQNYTDNDSIKDINKKIVVHITGAIKNPGIVELEEGSRIEDAIVKAGGLTEDADISNINLAYTLEDGTKIIIPRENDVQEIKDEDLISKESGKNVIEETNINTDKKSGSTININKATENELQTLPGIGSSLAKKIIIYREENGKFVSTLDIKNVNGIGENKYESIKDYISVN